jgi:hypothetical protein
MKKGLVVLLILAMTGAAFAQEVKVSGGVSAGLHIEQQGDGDATVTPYNDDAGVPLRADLTVKAAYDNYGAQVRIRTDLPNGPSLHHAFVWGEFLNDIIKVSAGKIRTGAAWGTDGDQGFSFDGVDGVRFEFKPIEGLDFGFALDAGHAPLTVGQFFKETVFGVKYTSDLFSANLAFKLDSDVVWAGATATSGDQTDTDKEAALIFGFKLSAIPALTAIVEGQLTELGAEDSAIAFEIYEYLGFQISDPFEAHLNFSETGNLDEAKNTRIGINPGLSFEVLPALFLKADLDFGIHTLEDSVLEIGIKPGVEYKFSDTASINGWYLGTINPDGVKDADLKNEIQIDFIWTF